MCLTESIRYVPFCVSWFILYLREGQWPICRFNLCCSAHKEMFGFSKSSPMLVGSSGSLFIHSSIKSERNTEDGKLTASYRAAFSWFAFLLCLLLEGRTRVEK